MTDVIAAQLRTVQAAGDMPAGLDPELEAISLLTMSAGLGTSVLAGRSSPGQAQARSSTTTCAACCPHVRQPARQAM